MKIVRKAAACTVAAVMIMSTFSIAFAAESESQGALKAQSFSDTSAHWASAAIDKWAGYDVLKGSEGTFRPNAPITRAEMATMLDNMMDYQIAAKNSFSDVPSGAWYADAVLKANAAGILTGDGAGHATPTANITREQAALMLGRAFAVAEGTKSASKFNDGTQISSWAAPLVYGMEAAGYISGYEGKLNPKNNITRAEVVTIINNAVKAYYTEAGTYTDSVDRLAIIKVSDVIIKDAVMSGNVIVANGKKGVILEGTFTNVTVASGAEVVIKGTVAKLDVEKAGAVDIQSGTIATLNIVDGAKVSIAASATVKTANVTGAAEIKGTGKIELAVISGEGAIIAQTPAKVEVKEGASASVGGKAIKNESAAGGGGIGGGTQAEKPSLTLDEDSVKIGGNPVTKEGAYFLINKEWSADTALSARVTGSNFDPAETYPMVVRAESKGGFGLEFSYNVIGSAMNVTDKEITQLNLIDKLTGADLMDDVNSMINMWINSASEGDIITVKIQNDKDVLFSMKLKVY